MADGPRRGDDRRHHLVPRAHGPAHRALHPQRLRLRGLVLTAYILFAFGLAVLAGQLLRRSIPAMIAAFVPWLAVRIFVEFALRPRFMAPVTFAQNCSKGCFGSTGVTSVPSATGRIGDLIVSSGGGVAPLTRYQPASRFWEFQSIEAGIFVALTLAALGTAVWLLHRSAA